MSDTDSFIDEVSEEVRRDKLYGYLRRYGWIAAVVVIGIVGAAAFTEYRKAQSLAQAQTIGDGILDALGEEDVAARAAALATLQVEGSAAAITGLMTAAALQEAGDLAAARDRLNALAVDADVPDVYREVAAFKAVLIVLPDDDLDARRQTLGALAQPGGAFRLLAMEQLAQMDVAAGAPDDAVAAFRAIIEDAGVSRGLRERAQQMIVALGAELEPGSAEE